MNVKLEEGKAPTFAPPYPALRMAQKLLEKSGLKKSDRDKKTAGFWLKPDPYGNPMCCALYYFGRDDNLTPSEASSRLAEFSVRFPATSFYVGYRRTWNTEPPFPYLRFNTDALVVWALELEA